MAWPGFRPGSGGHTVGTGGGEKLVYTMFWGDFWRGGHTWAWTAHRTHSYCWTILRGLLQNNKCSLMIGFWFSAYRMCVVFLFAFDLMNFNCLLLVSINEKLVHDCCLNH